MTAGRAFSILIFILLLGGCADARSRAQKDIERVTAQQLRRDAARLYKNIFAGPWKTLIILNEENWPRSFSELHPERITVYPDGFALRLESSGDTEAGLYIVPLEMDHDPTPTPWASFEKLSDGIFWYSFKP